jgi:hypothetical protein
LAEARIDASPVSLTLRGSVVLRVGIKELRSGDCPDYLAALLHCGTVYSVIPRPARIN